MAGRFGVATAVATALAAGVAETVQQLLSVNIAFKLTAVAVTHNGNSNTAVPVLVEVVRQSTPGTASANNPVKADDSIADALNTTGQSLFTVEPTSGEVLRAWYVHPQTGIHIQTFDLAPMLCGVGDRLGIRCTAPAGVDVTVTAAFEE